MMYTSLKLSKKLKEAGCELEFRQFWTEIFMAKNISEFQLFHKISLPTSKKKLVYPAYHILEDICIKYAKEFFGEKKVEEKIFCLPFPTAIPTTLQSNAFVYFPIKILEMLQQNKPQKEIEKYIWENCLFNPKNKINITIDKGAKRHIEKPYQKPVFNVEV